MSIQAVIHSLQGEDTVAEIRRLAGDNQYAALYNGEWYSAIFNPFTGRYYVDNLYGNMTAEQVEQRAEPAYPQPQKQKKTGRGVR